MGALIWVFLIIFVIIFLVNVIRNIARWSKNNESPVLTVQAFVLETSRHTSHDANGGSHTTYYATFQVPSGSRMEFRIHRQDYDALLEGSQGELTFQGTRYLGFRPLAAE
ncbi:MAG: DUF2500 domain-containing protein [Oscillospiraceae bacterium]|jgi:hypothetical protein|nr:DUF2500 domain-containing protein [Oscillospiraceae bacterium]